MKKKILIVDDETDMRRLLEYNLKKAGYEVYSATDGEEAIAKAKKNEPDLILTDIMMPQLNGYEFCKKLRSEIKTHSIPVIFVTAKGQLTDVQKGFKLGAYDYITKPFDPLHLLNKLEALLKK